MTYDLRLKKTYDLRLYKTLPDLRLLPLLLLFSLSSFAQEQKGALATANEAFAKYEYATAAKLYEKLLQKNNKDGFIIERLATSYKEMNNYDAAEKYYTSLISLPGTAPVEWLYFADMLKSTGKYAAAKEIYKQYKQRGKEEVTNKILGCDSALYWIKHPNGYMIENMAYLNTSDADWGATYNTLTNTVIFVSDSLRNTKKGFFKKTFNDNIYRRTDNHFQKIYAITNEKGDPFANQIHEFDPLINGFDYHTGPVVFSSNFDSIYFTVTHTGTATSKGDSKHKAGELYRTQRLELYLSTQNSAAQWNKPVPFAYNNPSAFSIGHAALSKDGSSLYFTSDMPGGVGGLDIWYCDRLITGNWSLPKNCGTSINTPDDDAFPVISFDGNLYFASKGHIGMGGYDLFVAAGEKNNWTTPRNLGYPLNSSTDDFYFFAKDETSGFFSSNRKGGKGDDDIYQFVTNVPLQISRPNGSLVLETTVIDNETKQPISEASLDIINTNSDVKWQLISNSIGKNWQPTENNTPYAIAVSKQGYYSTVVAINTKNATSDTFRVTIPLDNQSHTKPTPKVYRLADTITSLHEGDKFRLNNIHYNFDKDNIRPDAAKILDTLVTILHQYPTLIIELSSHTDARGTDEYNENLAERRAKSAVAYLISRGINKRRLIAKGYGEMLLLNGCSNDVPCTEEQHQANRRTEVKVLRF